MMGFLCFVLVLYEVQCGYKSGFILSMTQYGLFIALTISNKKFNISLIVLYIYVSSCFDFLILSGTLGSSFFVAELQVLHEINSTHLV